MKKRGLILSVCCFAAALIAALTSIGMSTSATVTKGWSDVSIESEYGYKTVFNVQKRTYTVGSNVYNASALLCYPDGTVSENNASTLDQVGIYTVKYSVAVGDMVYAESENFVVNYPHYDVESDKSSISYAVPDRAQSAGVIAKLAQNDSLVFTQYIDFTKISSLDNLVKGYVVPDVAGANDFTELVFTFTDSEDSSVYFKVHFYAYDWTYNTYVAANGQNQVPVGINQTQGAHEDDGYGLWSYVTFKSSATSGVVAPDATQFFISMNYPEKKLYTVGYPGQKTEIVDLDDTSVFKSAWTGFPSGKARMSVEAYNYTGATATVCITEVFGINDLSNNRFVDGDKPILTVDDEYAGEMPMALKGYSYQIPQATAYDAYARDCDVKISVLYNYGMDSSVYVPVKDGKFVTDKVGTYGIVYEASDKVGNTASEVRTVVAYERTPDIDFEIPSGSAHTVKSGEWVEVSDIDEDTVVGGSGKKTVAAFIEKDGKREEISGGFRATETGIYKVVYVVTDYVGKTAEKSYEINVIENDKPVLEKDFDVYPAYISGGEYVIPSYRAYVTKNGKLEEELCEVKIEDGNGTRTFKAGEKATLFVKNNGDLIKFSVISGGVTLAIHESVGITAWVQEEAGNRFHLENYLAGEGFTTEKTSGGMVLSATDTGAMRFVFANALSSRHLTARVGGIKGNASSSAINVKLFDAIDGKVGFAFTLSGNETTYIDVEGSRYELTDMPFGENSTFEMLYTDNKLSVNGTQIALKNFGGFEREKIFIEIEYAGYGENAGMTFVSVGNCNFNTAQTDRFAPIITSEYETGGVQPRGTEYVLHAPVAYDVYSPNLDYYLTVTAPDGSFVKALDGTVLNKVDPTVDYVIKLDDIGEYKVEYSIAETKSFVSRPNAASLNYTLTIVDEFAPEILWKSAFPTELTVGDMFILPEYEVSDNCSAAENIIVRVFVETPASQLLMLPGNSILMTHEGEYEIRVMIVDEAGNIGSYITHINVKRAK